MITDLDKGRIYKGGMAQVSVPVFPHCFSPEEVTDLVLNFYTEIGGTSIEFSGDTITLAGNIATVVFQPVQLDALADGLLRYNVSFSDMVFEYESKYYIKTPNPYTPIEIIDEEKVKEIVDEKIEEGGFATSAETAEIVAEAMEAETARTESTYQKIGSFDVLEKLNDYFFYTEYPYLDKAFADEYFRGKAPVVAGGCTSVRYGNKYGRNFDYYYSNLAEFFVKTKDTIGIAGGNPVLTKAFVESDKVSDLYRVMPFYLQDGYNFKTGLFANINMVNREESKGTTTYSAPAVGEREQVCSIALVRYIIDKFDSAHKAVEYIKNFVSIYNPQSIIEQGFELHWMIGDKDNTYVLEIVNGEVKYTEQNILSNFYVDGTTANTDGTFYSIKDNADHDPMLENGLTKYASGVERYNFVRAHLGDMDIEEIMAAIKYTHTYTDSEGQDFWYSEYVGGELGIDNTIAEYQADGRIDRIKAQYEERTRENPVTWHTMHSCVYDFEKKVLSVVSQEDTGNTFEFKFEAGMSRDEVEEIVASALTQYNPTENFKTINGNSIIGQGNIEIQGGSGDSNYLIVDSLDEIENPVEGMRAYVNAQYEQKEAYKVIPHPREEYPSQPWYDDGMARLDRPDYGGFEFRINTEEEGNNRWRTEFRDWSDTPYGYLKYDKWNDLGFWYGVIEGYMYIIPELDTDTVSIVLDRSEIIPGQEVSIKTADAKEYIYFEEYGWIERNMVLQEGQSHLQYKEYFFSDHCNPLDYGINIKYGDRVVKIVSYRVYDADNIYLMGYYQEHDQKYIQYVFQYTGHDGYLGRAWEDRAFVGDNFISSRLKGIKGGYFYHYTWDRTEEFTADGDNNRRMIGYLFPEQAGFSISSNQCWDRVATIYHGTESDHDWSWELRRNDNDYEGIENNGNWRDFEYPNRFSYRRNTENYNFELFFSNPEEYTVVLNDNPDINAAIEEITLNAFPVWIYPFQDNNPRQVRMEIEGYWGEDYGDWKPTLMQYEREIDGKYFKCVCHWHEEGWLDFYSNIPIAIDQEGDTRLWQQAQQGYFTLNDYGYMHLNTIPDILYQNYNNEGDVVMFGEEEAEYLIEQAIAAETARTESTYVKAEALTAYTPTTDFATVNGQEITEGGDITINEGFEIIPKSAITSTIGQQIYANPDKYLIYDKYYGYFFYLKKNPVNDRQIFVCHGIPNNDYGQYEIEWYELSSNGTFSLNAQNLYTKPKVDTLFNGKVNNVNGVAGIWSGTQAEYDAITTKDPNTLYIVKN